MTLIARRPVKPIRNAVLMLAAVATVAAVAASGGAAVAASTGNVAKAQSICRSGDKAIQALHQPSSSDAKASAAYVTKALGYATRTLMEVRALHWSSAVAHALRIEASGLKIEKQEVPAIRAGNVALMRQLSNRAATLTHPADLALKRAGLGVCVGSG